MGYDCTFLPRDLGRAGRLLESGTELAGEVLLAINDEDLGEAVEVMVQARRVLAEGGCADAAGNLAWVVDTLIAGGEPMRLPGRPWRLILPAGHVQLMRDYLRDAGERLKCRAPLHSACRCVRLVGHDGPCGCRWPSDASAHGRGGVG